MKTFSEFKSNRDNLRGLKAQLEKEGYAHTHSVLAGRQSGIHFAHNSNSKDSKKYAVIRWGKINYHTDDMTEEVELDEGKSVGVSVQLGAPEGKKYSVFEHTPKKSVKGRATWKDVSFHTSEKDASTAADAHAKKTGYHRMQKIGEDFELDEMTSLVGIAMKNSQHHFVYKIPEGYEIQNRSTGKREVHKGSLGELERKGYSWVAEEFQSLPEEAQVEILEQLDESWNSAKTRALWMGKFEKHVTQLAPKHTGKIDWNTATHLFNTGKSHEDAAEQYVNNRKELGEEAQTQKYKVSYDIHGSNNEVPLYSNSKIVRTTSHEDAISTIKKLVGGRNHKSELVKEDAELDEKYIGFDKLSAKLGPRLAGWIGRKKYGNKGMTDSKAEHKAEDKEIHKDA